MIEGTYRSRKPRVAVTSATAKFSRRRFLFLRTPQEDADALVDLSVTGIKIRSTTEQPLGKGDTVDIEVVHPAGGTTVSATARVQWVDGPLNGEWSAGLQFTQISKSDHEKLQRVIARELGSTVESDVKIEGYLAVDQRGDGVAWLAYDESREKRARITEGPTHYEVWRDGGGHYASKAFEEALCWALGFPKRRLTIKPAVRPAPKRP